MRVALVETDTLWEDEAGNRVRIGEALAGLDADVAVLPEMAFSGFSMAAQPDPHAEAWLQSQAVTRGVTIVAGYVGEGPANVAGVFEPDGARLARYTKLHPFSFAGEHFAPGDELPVFELCGFRTALLICYDLRFPEPFRKAVRDGAELFIVIANWPTARLDHWHTLCRARAIENQAYVVAVNRVGEDPNVAYASSSVVIDPMGKVVHEGPGTATLDVKAVREWRAQFPALKDIRTDRY